MYSTVYCGPKGVLNIEVSLYRTVNSGPKGVLSIEVSLYRTVYCGPKGVLSIEVSLYRTVYCGPKGVLSFTMCTLLQSYLLFNCMPLDSGGSIELWQGLRCCIEEHIYCHWVIP